MGTLSIKKKLFTLCAILMGTILILGLGTGNWKKHIQPNTSLQQLKSKRVFNVNLPMIFIITPTYKRPEQKAVLTNLCNTFALVDNILWMVVEDSSNKSKLVTRLLQRCVVTSVHLNAKTSTSGKDMGITHRGVIQRNAALTWLRKYPGDEGVVYFADDDNIYDVQIFNEMRYTQKVSVWPVGLIAGMPFESAVVHNGQVIGWKSGVKTTRKFEIDMAGFAVSLKLIKHYSSAFLTISSGHGMLENDFLLQLDLELHDLQPKADNCSKVYVWHTKFMRQNRSKKTIANFDKTPDIDMDVLDNEQI